MSPRTIVRRSLLFASVVALVLAFASTQAFDAPLPSTLVIDQGGPKLRFAVIGDYGDEGEPASRVAALVRGWKPDLVITTGDNNYPDGEASTIDRNIGQYYAPFIAPYKGKYGTGGTTNRFFPSLGNHDWHAAGARPYIDYFGLPGNERYYDFTAGPVHFFALDSDKREPDGITADSRQAAWLRSRLPASDAPWRIVYMHHPPYSSGDHGSTPATQWQYEEMGASAVLAGHDHSYERLDVGGIPYFVNGLGGTPTYEFREVLPESRARFTGENGAMLVEATANAISYRFYDVESKLIDQYRQCRQRDWKPGAARCFAGAWGGRAR